MELGGSATFLTEFGLCEPNATLTNSTGDIECNFILDQVLGITRNSNIQTQLLMYDQKLTKIS